MLPFNLVWGVGSLVGEEPRRVDQRRSLAVGGLLLSLASSPFRRRRSRRESGLPRDFEGGELRRVHGE